MCGFRSFATSLVIGLDASPQRDSPVMALFMWFTHRLLDRVVLQVHTVRAGKGGRGLGAVHRVVNLPPVHQQHIRVVIAESHGLEIVAVA